LGAPDPEDELCALPTSMGRYVPIDILGMGGMGVVYRARDPKLDRLVALKVVRADTLGTKGEARLLREAQAMAQVSHPNVITVLDVTSGSSGIVVAMELINGVDLRAWLAERPRSWDEVLPVFVAAGRGLAAVHEAGLVHRDFKPANVLVEHPPAGRVLVTDFGLARGPTSASSLAAPGNQLERSEGDTTEECLTRTGFVLGTPAYMAPEQAAGATPDGPSDQYAFCVALWEGLCGTRPFAANDDRRVVPPWPSEIAVPSAVSAAIRRGLSFDPRRRFANMSALLARLQPRSWAQARWLGLGVLVVGAGTAVATTRPPGDSGCLDGPLGWNDSERDAVATQLAATGAPLANELAPRVVEGLDRYADQWRAAADEVCPQLSDGDGAATEADLRIACLGAARLALRGTVAAFAQADEATVVRSLELVEELPAVAACKELDPGSEPALPDDRQLAAAVEAQQAIVARVAALSTAARYAEALSLAEPVPETDAASRYAPLRARALTARGEVYRALSRESEAAADFTAAVSVAMAAKDDRTAARASRLLAFTLAFEQGRADDALPHARQALSLAQRIEPGGRLESAALSTLGVVFDQAEDYDAAREHHLRSLELSRSIGDARDMGTSYVALAQVHMHEGDLAAAAEALEHAVELERTSLPPSHPVLATSVNNLASVYAMAGQLDRAQPLMQEAHEIRLAAFGPDHKAVGDSLCNLGNIERLQGNLDRAVTTHRQCLQIFERKLGPEHPRVAMALNGLASALDAQGEYEESVGLMRRSLAIRVAAHGPDSEKVALLHLNLANTLGSLDRWEESDRHETEALRIYEETAGADSPSYAKALLASAERAHDRKRHAEAVPRLERALAVLDPLAHDYPIELAGGLYLLGKVRAALGQAQEALRAHRRALDLRQEHLGEHTDVMHSQRRIADLLASQGDDVAARPLYAAALRYAEAHDDVASPVRDHLRAATSK